MQSIMVYNVKSAGLCQPAYCKKEVLCMKEKNLAIITARGGSKRIPRKNIKEFCGKPII